MKSSRLQARPILAVLLLVILPPAFYLALLELIARIATDGPAQVHGPAAYRIAAHFASTALAGSLAMRLLENRAITALALWFSIVAAVSLARVDAGLSEPLGVLVAGVAGWLLAVGGSTLLTRRSRSAVGA